MFAPNARRDRPAKPHANGAPWGAKHRKSVVAKADKPQDASPCPPNRERNDRIDWASLLRRTYHVDVFGCLSCGGKARPISVVEDGEVVKKILGHLGLRTEPLPLAPQRPPPQRLLLLLPREDQAPGLAPSWDANELEDAVVIDELREGGWQGPAPPEWDRIDAPAPGAEAFVDEVYEEPMG